jgi:hypothetical protein
MLFARTILLLGFLLGLGAAALIYIAFKLL